MIGVSVREQYRFKITGTLPEVPHPLCAGLAGIEQKTGRPRTQQDACLKTIRRNIPMPGAQKSNRSAHPLIIADEPLDGQPKQAVGLDSLNSRIGCI